jgi:hypothetical protein
MTQSAVRASAGHKHIQTFQVKKGKAKEDVFSFFLSLFLIFSVRLLDLDNGRAEPGCGGGLLQKIPLIFSTSLGNERTGREVLCYRATGV